ncbi:YqhR family membrane protein [Paenibacillus thermotolerans]|uniref:YqhR family membrane protein n=1 Tax=Paenibacillus thermotolerans TaxID=3027807 RepID=UPI002368669E|nr:MULTISPECIES: YqhR family membrane protein [unclassified Paenibacillus]
MAKKTTMKKAGTATIVPTNKWFFALYLGFFAGVIWGALRIVAYLFRFTELVPGFLIEPFFTHDFLAGTGGYAVGWFAWIVFSIAAAYIYAFLLHRAMGPWIGMLYGLCWFAFWFLVGPWFGMMKPIGLIRWDTLWTEGSIFVLWGVFIGYSVAFEFSDERQRESGEGTLRLQ